MPPIPAIQDLSITLAHYIGLSGTVFAIGALPLATVFAIEFTAPIFTALGLHFAVPGERLQTGQWLGVALAFLGMALAFADGIATQFPRLSDMPTMPNKAEQGIISYASENAEAAFAAALDLIGRRTDIVAVQLPEPTAPSWPDGQLASFGDFEDTDHDVSVLVNAYPGQVSIGFNNFSPNTARNLAAALLAAAARADAADGAK